MRNTIVAQGQYFAEDMAAKRLAKELADLCAFRPSLPRSPHHQPTDPEILPPLSQQARLKAAIFIFGAHQS
jgi:hypothetical protein